MPELRNARRERFAQEYVKDLNASKAAERAGYRHPRVKGCQLKRHPEVQARITELKGALAERTKVTQDQIIHNLRESRQLAHDHRQFGAAVSAEGVVAKVTGHWTDRFKEEIEGIDAEAQIKKLTSGNEFAERSLRLLLSGDVEQFMRFAQPRRMTPELVKGGVA